MARITIPICRLVCLLLIAGLVSVDSVQRCLLCPQHWENKILGIVNRALNLEHRNIYYPFNSDWMNELSKPDSVVSVDYLGPDGLSAHAPGRNGQFEPDHFQIIYSYHTGATADLFLRQMDAFLTLNPCWIPLLDPCSDCTRHPVPDSAAPRYANSAVLVQLPGLGHSDTCRLYNHLVKRQFPTNCMYHSSHIVSYALHNIGWSHTLHTMADAMMTTFMESHEHKVFIAPYAEQYIGKDQFIVFDNGSVFERYRSGWYWANEETCETDTYLFNPWACNFLSFSNCSNRDSAFRLPADTKKSQWKGDITYLLRKLGITWVSRRANRDAPLANDNQWIEQRLLSFVSRPNSRMRQMIRRSLIKIRPLPRFSETYATHPLSTHYSALQATDSSRRFSKSHLTRGNMPCIALHVRHGDAMHDSRNNPMTDRSFHAHVEVMKNVSIRLGTNVVFLLTDNATLPLYAAPSYPEYQWYMQVRPMRFHARTFDVHNEKDIQLELAHLLADIVHGGSCVAVVGCFDSGVAAQVQRAIGDRSKGGQIHKTQYMNVMNNVVRGWNPVQTR